MSVSAGGHPCVQVASADTCLLGSVPAYVSSLSAPVQLLASESVNVFARFCRRVCVSAYARALLYVQHAISVTFSLVN